MQVRHAVSLCGGKGRQVCMRDSEARKAERPLIGIMS
jgi:hypothetical protein